MPPKKKAIPKSITDVPPVHTTDQTPELAETADQKTVQGAKNLDNTEQTSGQSPQIIVTTSEPEKKDTTKIANKADNATTTLIRLDSSSNKTEEQRLEERKIKFATQTIQASENFQQSFEGSAQQVTTNQTESNSMNEIAKDSKIQLLLKDFTEDDRKIVRNRMTKFGLSEVELKDVLTQIKVKNAKNKQQEKKEATKDKQEQYGKQKKQSRFQRYNKHDEPRKKERIDFSSKPKRSENDFSRSRDTRPGNRRQKHSLSHYRRHRD